MPWTSDGPSYGFGDAAAQLPQPDWFAEAAVSRQDGDASSTLSLYRTALRLRRELQGPEELSWVGGSTTADTVVHLARPGGWQSVTNFGTDPMPLPAGELLLTSDPLIVEGLLPGDTTVWLRA
jgi:alpha-glucosidase